MSGTRGINITLHLPPHYRLGSLHESCRRNDPEPFCVSLVKDLGAKYQSFTAFSSVSFEDAFENCLQKFEETNAKRYWGD